MDDGLIQVVAYPGWIVGVTRGRRRGYRCWVITPELLVLTDGESHRTSLAALKAGRWIVEFSLAQDIDGD
jgi:hypothetical protein